LREIARENERLFREVSEGEKRFRRLARSVWSVQEDERRRLALELHDGIGQTLTAVRYQLERLRRPGTAAEAPPAGAIEELIATVSGALDEMRQLARRLRPAVLDDLGLEPALRWLARNAKPWFGLDVDLHVSGLAERLDAEIETLAFRVVQEALTNVSRHSGAQAARVDVVGNGHALSVRVRDDGRGFDARAVLAGDAGEAGVGLRGIRDRVALFGGALTIDAAPGAGTTVSFSVPLADAGRSGA
jgi:two-component system sensor histidine kinase UhpB